MPLSGNMMFVIVLGAPPPYDSVTVKFAVPSEAVRMRKSVE
jgi:hypothetical protein